MSQTVALWRCEGCGDLQWLRYYSGQWHCPRCEGTTAADHDPALIPWERLAERMTDHPPSNPDE